MGWTLAIRCIATARRQSSPEPDTLLKLLDHEDTLVAYAAKEQLRDLLVATGFTEDAHCVNEVVKDIMTRSTRTLGRETGGFRFQLLRHLLKTKADGEGDSGDKYSERVVEYPYLDAVLKNLQHVETMVCGVLVPTVSSERGDEFSGPAPYSVQYEALVFLSDLMECVHGVDSSQLVELSKQMLMLMETVFLGMDYVSQPTFVSCAVLGLLGEFQELMTSWKEQAHDKDGVEIMYSDWLDKCLAWVLQSSCTSEAVRLLNSNEPSHVSSQEAFIGQSDHYPFLQQCVLCLSRIGVALLEAMPTMTTSDSDISEANGVSSWRNVELPHRQQLFAVLSEQDDVMIEVLNGLTRIWILADGGSKEPEFLVQQRVWPTHFASEYDPNLLFADLVDTLGRDHLVLLDLLVSNETKMLEYTMTYLRHLSTYWNASKQKLQSDGRLNEMMSVLIRLRLEIERLVAAGLFPYRAGPLTRRLLAIENLYEEPSDTDVEQYKLFVC